MNIGILGRGIEFNNIILMVIWNTNLMASIDEMVSNATGCIGKINDCILVLVKYFIFLIYIRLKIRSDNFIFSLLSLLI